MRPQDVEGMPVPVLQRKILARLETLDMDLDIAYTAVVYLRNRFKANAFVPEVIGGEVLHHVKRSIDSLADLDVLLKELHKHPETQGDPEFFPAPPAPDGPVS